MAKQKTGTWEWASRTFNSVAGCQHSCRYCYACAMAVHYRKFDPAKWRSQVLVEKMHERKFRKGREMVMYPSAHDIIPEYLPHHLAFIKKLLEAYPRVLLVTKPHLESIKGICEAFGADRERILFRFTIGSTSDATLSFWEPNAPSFGERLDCLKLAHSLGFGTSVSCEPMLDDRVEDVIQAVSPYVNETIWLGKVNRFKHRLALNGHSDPETLAEADQLIGWQSDANILALYQRLKDNPMIRWKDSIRKVVER